MAVLSSIAQQAKLKYFLSMLPKDAKILEVGCADGWVGRFALRHGWRNFTGIDIVDPGIDPGHKFVLGDINEWRSLGLSASSFDAIIAFEVIEHGDFYAPMAELLRPGGKLMVTTPLPNMDWLCKVFEAIGLNQRRTSPHTHLIYLRDLPEYFRPIETKVKGAMSQWGVFERVIPQPRRASTESGPTTKSR